MTKHDIIQNVARKLKIDEDVVRECHNKYWNDIVKKDITNPDFDNYELPQLGVLQIKRIGLRSTIKREIRKLRSIRKKLITKPNSVRNQNLEKHYKDNIVHLWKLKNEIF